MATSWSADASGTVYALALGDGILYAGGAFTAIGARSRQFVAALDAASGEITTWQPRASGYVAALALDAEVAWAAGEFTSIGEQPQSGIAAISRVLGRSFKMPPAHGASAPFQILSAGPNPAARDVAVRFRMSEAASVRAMVHDIAGRAICVLHEGRLDRGDHTVTWSGRDARGNRVGSGVYFVRLTAAGASETQRVLILR